MKRFIYFLLLSLAFSDVFSQTEYKAEEFQSALMQTKSGAIIVYTGTEHSFTTEIVGNVMPGDKPNFVTVDNKILQCIILPFHTQLNFDSLSEDTHKEQLAGYMEYELDYIREQLGSKKLKEEYEFVTLNDKIFLFWSYDMPKSFSSVDKQCYLVTICFDQLLILNSPVVSGKPLEEFKEFLTTIGKTLKLNNQTIDLEKLYNDLNQKE